MVKSTIQLNPEQKRAVELIDGPMLVLAGPGTGKTQLLSARIANILEQDNAPRNILCLTFTEAAAQNMRQRLVSMIGPDAYDVHIATYHSFGSDIINSYPEFFQTIHLDRSEDVRMERPIDELAQIQTLEAIVENLSYDDPLLSARYFIKSLLSTISDLKRWHITPEQLNTIASENLKEIASLQGAIDTIVNEVGGISRKKAEYTQQYTQLLEHISKATGALSEQATTELSKAFLASEEMAGSSKPLTVWKNSWLHKNEDDKFTFTREADSLKLQSLANVYVSYQKALQQNAQYDFDDMIVSAIEGVENNPELRFNLQEKYQYILLDEFQDTNRSQFELVNSIADHPVHEGRPNIMAVGDDDQAIYAFQGAEVSNMIAFKKQYRDVEVINLTQNYRSHPDIIHTAHNVASQIEDRLHKHLDGVEKTLTAAAPDLPASSLIERHEFNSKASEFGWVSRQINTLIGDGVEPSEIAILAPKHSLLEGLVPFLVQENLPVSYEKRENILQTRIVQQLKEVVELLIAISDNDSYSVNTLFPRVLSQDFWEIPVSDIWKVNWAYASSKTSKNWAEAAMKNNSLQSPINFLLGLGMKLSTLPLEHVLDAVTGAEPLTLGPDETYLSPFKDYYFNETARDTKSVEFYEAISHLSVIRTKLREHQNTTEDLLTANDFINFFNMYEAAEASLINSHPIATSSSAVQLMTAFKSKGLEFEHVFIISAHDDIWGITARGRSNKLSLPKNMQYIRYGGANEDELRRLLFVAITRAKQGLFITSHAHKDSGKKNEPIKYLAESDGKALVLPEGVSTQYNEQTTENNSATMNDVATLWYSRHLPLTSELKTLLQPRLDSFKLSPTHVNSYIDLEHSGPDSFILQTLLRFPQAPSFSGEYGTAIHNTLEWYQLELNGGKKPTSTETRNHFMTEVNNRYLTKKERAKATERGLPTIESYISSREEMFKKQALTEVNFATEGVTVGDAVLTGKIDRLEINIEEKTIDIVDYKTGQPHTRWESSLKLLKYEQQLYLYKTLIERSNTYREYTVTSARLEFIEPTASGKTAEPLYVKFDEKKENDLLQLVESIWSNITSCKIIDVSQFRNDVIGSKQFIKSLLEEQ